MLKNITLSADEMLIRKAREKAKQEHTTINSQFRQWLESYTSFGTSSSDYEDLMEQLSYSKPTGTYSRDELNER